MISDLVPTGTYFEDFGVGQRWRHARGTTIDEVENQLLSKLVVNTAQEHWNDDSMRDSPWGNSRIVFGLVTASIMVGLASQDTAEHAIREVGMDDLTLLEPVFHGDVIYAYSEVTEVSAQSAGSGQVSFRHWAVTSDDRPVATCTRTVLIRSKTL